MEMHTLTEPQHCDYIPTAIHFMGIINDIIMEQYVFEKP